MTAIAGPAPRAQRPTWGQALWAVIGGSIFAFAGGVLVLLPMLAIGLPMPLEEATTGRGWPWRVEGPWSLAADVGPLLLMGFVFAYGVEAFLVRHTDVVMWRAPLVLAAALLGWVTFGGVSKAGVAGGGLGTFVLLVILARELSIRERPRWRWTPVKAWLTLITGLALVGATLSYGFLHPLSGSISGSDSLRDSGQVTLRGGLQNQGRSDVRLLAITAPGAETVRFKVGEIVGTEAFDGGEFEIVARCSAASSLDRLHVRLRVLGQDVDQVVRLNRLGSGGCY